MTLLLSSVWRNFRPFPSIWRNFTSHRALQQRHQSNTAKSAKTLLTVHANPLRWIQPYLSLLGLFFQAVFRPILIFTFASPPPALLPKLHAAPSITFHFTFCHYIKIFLANCGVKCQKNYLCAHMIHVCLNPVQITPWQCSQRVFVAEILFVFFLFLLFYFLISFWPEVFKNLVVFFHGEIWSFVCWLT